jgi:transcriptional regulator with XRE-family HTH domain
MNLRDWLYKNRLTVTDFARSIGVSRDWMSMIVHGYGKPGARLRRDIAIATKGEVSEDEMRVAKTRKFRSDPI